MDQTYYDIVIKEIEDLFDGGEDDKATARLEEELSMLYIPPDVEERLREIEADHRDHDVPPLTLEQIEGYLSSDVAAIQLAGVSALIKLNLRDHKDIIDAFLVSDGFLDAKVLLVDELIAQGLRERSTMIKDGIEYEFIPIYCERPSDSDGFIAAMGYLSKTIGNEDPSLAALCKKLVSRIALLQLPLSLSEEEGLLIAKSTIAYVYGLIGDDERLEAYRDDVGTELIDAEGIERALEGR